MNVEETLVMLGIDYEEAHGEFRAPCPMHKARTGKEDRNPSWYINAETGLSLCFSCQYRANLERLVSDVRGIDIAQAKALVVQQRGEADVSALRRRLERASTWVAARRGSSHLPESSLARFDAPPTWALRDRRLTDGSVQAYGVMWDDPSGSWVLPIRDPYTHSLMGWQIKSQVTKGFVRNRPNGVKKSSTLFGVDLLGSPDLDVWVVESPLDAVRLHGVGHHAVATFGSRFSLQQLGLLSTFRRVVLGFDNDSAGRSATEEFIHYAGPKGVDMLVAEYPEGCKDPGDCTDRQLTSLRPRHFVRY